MPSDGHANCTRLHDLDLTATHLTNLINLRATFPDDASNKIIRNINLLSLKGSSRRSSWIHHVRSWKIPGPGPGPWTATTGGFVKVTGTWTLLAVGEPDSSMGFLLLYQNIANVVGGDMDGISDSGDAEYALMVHIQTRISYKLGVYAPL